MNQHDSPSCVEPDRDDTLRRMRLPEPPATLRARTLGDVRAVLAANDRPAPNVAWRFAVVGAVLALCLWSMSWRGVTVVPTPRPWRATRSRWRIGSTSTLIWRVISALD